VAADAVAEFCEVVEELDDLPGGGELPEVRRRRRR
jgi:hypothetical protein